MLDIERKMLVITCEHLGFEVELILSLPNLGYV